MNTNLIKLSENELAAIDGGSWIAAAKGAAALAAAGFGGLVVGAAGVAAVYYGCKWLFG